MVNRTEKFAVIHKHVRIDNIGEMPNLICSKTTVGWSYNLMCDNL